MSFWRYKRCEAYQQFAYLSNSNYPHYKNLNSHVLRILRSSRLILFAYLHFVSSKDSMASISATSMTLSTLSINQTKVTARIPGLSLSVGSGKGRSFPSLTARHFKISCAAKPETVDKVCAIVKKQLALSADTAVTGESKFAALGADSLDTVEIVMGLEEEFGISVEEESAQTIATVQDAADLIEKLLVK